MMSNTHNIPIGTLVEIETGARLFVVHHALDADAHRSPLYSLSARRDDTAQERDGLYNASWLNGLPEESLTVVDEPRWQTKVATLLEEIRGLSNEVQDLRAACKHYADQKLEAVRVLSE
jgi:hypothetical protein